LEKIGKLEFDGFELEFDWNADKTNASNADCSGFLNKKPDQLFKISQVYL
jgi:hypothetical protein